MKKVALSLALATALVLSLTLIASAVDQLTPSVNSVTPGSAFNDIETRITISGDGFAVDASGAPPAVALQGAGAPVALTDVTWVDTQTLTATVPWGLPVAAYALVVTNAGAGPVALPGAFEVKSGINTWNAGELNGASVRELVMKPGDPNTLYALAYDVGVFRSDDAGAHWTFTSANVIGNAVFAVDPFHPEWLYSYMNDGLWVSKDEGDTWTHLNDGQPTNVVYNARVFVSPDASGTLFVGYCDYGSSVPTSVLGMRMSANGGASWTVVDTFKGMSVQSIAFGPVGSHDVVAATLDARVFRSADEGSTWTEVLKPPMPSGLGMNGTVTYNPYRADEVWISSSEMSGGMYKATVSDVTTWTSVSTWGTSGYPVTFTGPDDVYTWHAQSHDDGATWTEFGPWPTWGEGEVLFDPSDPLNKTVYVTNSTVGVQKSTDGGATWNTRNQGLTGMRCVQMAVSRTDPLHVWATFDGWDGVFTSTDGTSHWTFTEIPGSGQMWQVVADPFQDGRLYASGDGGFYTSTDNGATWNGGSWDPLLPAGAVRGLMSPLAADPHQPGHLLVASRAGTSSTHAYDQGFLFSSNDDGAHWSSVVVSAPVDSLAYVSSIVFDPDTTGTVYVTTGGSGLWRSTDFAEDHTPTWTRIDDQAEPHHYMASEYSIAIATHPHRVLLVSDGSGRPFRSFDNGVTWENKQNSGEVSARRYVFVDGDSTRLYSPDLTGLHFSSNVADSWSDAAGLLGQVQNTVLAYAHADGHTILYAATTGGRTGVVVARAAGGSVSAASVRTAAAPSSELVRAGIYRRAQVSVTATFTSSASQDGWILESSERSNRGGSANSTASTLRLGDDASRRQYRSVLSFATSGLPDNAVITGVKLRVRRQGVTGGGNPITAFRGVVSEVRNGFFSTSSSLQTGDFSAACSKTVGAAKPGLFGGWYTIDLSAARGFVNTLAVRSGLTQVRLRFALDDNNNRTANYLSLYSGNAASALRPQLVITYYVP